MTKILNKVRLEGTYPKIITVTIYLKHTANVILNGEKPKVLLLRSERRQGCALPALLFNIVLQVLTSAVRPGKERKGI